LMSPTLATTAALLICFAAHLPAEETADSYYHRGNANYQRGNFSYADAYSQRAGVWEKMKQYNSAMKDIQKAIELEPKKGGYYLDLAWYELFDRNPREAIAASLKALRLSPAKAMIKTNLAHVLQT
jgi:tetratricopeptide (TPR) repeat protein